MAISRSPKQYLGVRAILPPDLQNALRDPLSSDTAYIKGTLWLNSASPAAFMYSGSSGVWIPLSGGGGGSISLAAFGSSPNANGLTLTGSVLNMQPASGSFPGGVSTGIQSLAGAKTFTTSVASPAILLNGTSGVVSFLPQASFTSYNFNLPTTAGTNGQLLTSAGGGSSAMTWTNPSVPGAFPFTYENTFFSALAQNGYFVDTTSGSIVATLPASPSNSDRISFIVVTPTNTGNLSIQAAGGKKINIGTAVSASNGNAVNTVKGNTVNLVYSADIGAWYSQGVDGNWEVT